MRSYQFTKKFIAYFDPLLFKSREIKRDFEAWDRPSQIIQIRAVALLTALLYLIYAGMDHEILSGPALQVASFLHLFFLPALLVFIAILTFFPKLYSLMIGILIAAPVMANIGNLYLNTLLLPTSMHLSEIYLPEIYLSTIWTFAISGLRFYQALISGSCSFFFFLAYQCTIDIPQEIFFLHFLWIFSAFSFGVLNGAILNRTKKRIFLDTKQLEKTAMIDQLSGLYNRMKIESLCNEELERVKRYDHTFTLLLIDIDHFKEINDQFGHNMGDRVIKSFSDILLHSIRQGDKIGRWGGEEFLILFPHTKIEDAHMIAEKIRLNIMSHDFGIEQIVTISGGLAEYKEEDTIQKLIQLSDERLYKAKYKGRNQIKSN